MPARKKDDEIPFEEALSRLEKLVEDMESADLPLEQVLKNYEEGMSLSEHCTRKLTEAEAKLEILSKRPDAPSAPSAPPSMPSSADEDSLF